MLQPRLWYHWTLFSGETRNPADKYFQFVLGTFTRGSIAWGRNDDLRLTIFSSIFSLLLWKMQKSVRSKDPRREKPRKNQLYFALIPFFTWKNTFFSRQSTIHVSLTCSIGSRVTWCIWLGDTSEIKEREFRSHYRHNRPQTTDSRCAYEDSWIIHEHNRN